MTLRKLSMHEALLMAARLAAASDAWECLNDLDTTPSEEGRAWAIGMASGHILGSMDPTLSSMGIDVDHLGGTPSGIGSIVRARIEADGPDATMATQKAWRIDPRRWCDAKYLGGFLVGAVRAYRDALRAVPEINDLH